MEKEGGVFTNWYREQSIIIKEPDLVNTTSHLGSLRKRRMVHLSVL